MRRSLYYGVPGKKWLAPGVPTSVRRQYAPTLPKSSKYQMPTNSWKLLLKNIQAPKTMTEEFRCLVKEHLRKAIALDGGDLPMTTRRAITVVSEIIRENQENGELEGILNRNRVAALNRLLYIAKARSDSEEPTAKSLSGPARPKRHT